MNIKSIFIATTIAAALFTGCSDKADTIMGQDTTDEISVTKERKMAVIIEDGTKTRAGISVEEVAIVSATIQLTDPVGTITNLEWTPSTGDTLLFDATLDGDYSLAITETDANGLVTSESATLTFVAGKNYNVSVVLGKSINFTVGEELIGTIIGDQVGTYPEVRSLTTLPIWRTEADTLDAIAQIAYHPELDSIFRATLMPTYLNPEGKAGIAAKLGIAPSTGLSVLYGVQGIQITYRSNNSLAIGFGSDSLANKEIDQYKTTLPSTGSYDQEYTIMLHEFQKDPTSTLNYNLDLSRLHTIYVWSEQIPSETNLEIVSLKLMY